MLGNLLRLEPNIESFVAHLPPKLLDVYLPYAGAVGALVVFVRLFVASRKSSPFIPDIPREDIVYEDRDASARVTPAVAAGSARVTNMLRLVVTRDTLWMAPGFRWPPGTPSILERAIPLSAVTSVERRVPFLREGVDLTYRDADGSEQRLWLEPCDVDAFVQAVLHGGY